MDENATTRPEDVPPRRDEAGQSRDEAPAEPKKKSSRSQRWSGWKSGKTIAGRYEIARRLGSGAMGEVFLGEDRLLKKEVAIKVLRPDLARNRGTVRRFLREVALAQSVTHPSVVRIYDTGEAEGLPYFTMEYLQGQRLDEIIHQGRDGAGFALTIREIREVCWEVLHAMAAAHAVGVIHRDLKPSNVLLTHRGAIVMDFGVAGIDAAPEPSGTTTSPPVFDSLVRTEAGTIFGSPAYMAPELWEGAPASVQSDLYSFGVMLYQMLSGRLPFDAPTPAAFLEKLRTQTPTPVRSLRRDTPLTLALLVKRCMDVEPAHRPLSAKAAANLISPLRSRVRRRAAMVLGVAAVLLGGVYLAKEQATWTAYGLPDLVAEADLGAAVRSYDVGDRFSALRHLRRLHQRAPDSAAVAFWRATVHHDAGNDRGRVTACSQDAFAGSERWQALAASACGSTYSLPAAALGALTGSPGALGPEFLPLAVNRSLIPRLESARERAAVRREASEVQERLAREPDWSPLWALPTRWQLARVHLAVAQGRTGDALRQLAELADQHPTPLVRETGAWLDLLTGNVERSEETALSLLPDSPVLHIRHMLERGELERAWQHALDLEGELHHTRVQEMWCGYAYRFELPVVPDRCRDLGPGFTRMLWAASAVGAEDRAAMLPVEATMLRRQRELGLGQCQPISTVESVLTHSAAPFELYAAQLEITAALCSPDPKQTDLKYARRLANALLVVAPQDPFSILIGAQVDEALGDDHLARAKRLAVADRWRGADGELPLVARLRQRVGTNLLKPMKVPLQGIRTAREPMDRPPDQPSPPSAGEGGPP